MDIKYYTRLAYSVLAVGTVIALAIGFHHSNQIAVAKSTEFGACKRLQVLRIQFDRFSGVAYGVFVQSAEREYSLEFADVTSKTNITRQARRTHKISGDALASYAAQLNFVPRTDCQRAVEHPKSYILPKPKPFAKVTDAEWKYIGLAPIRPTYK